MIGSPFWNRMPVTGSQSHGLPHRPFPSFLEAVGEYLGPISSSFFSMVGPKVLSTAFLSFLFSRAREEDEAAGKKKPPKKTHQWLARQEGLESQPLTSSSTSFLTD